MDHDAHPGIEEFCAAQYYAFDAGAWIARAQRDGLRVAAAAEYLALTSWYGHEEELADVAARIRAQIDRGDPAQLPLARFSARTRFLLAQWQNRADDGP
jgi:hypothetical protein